ncbi:MAG: hypothetical protein IPM83_01270 [Ignavibacteria bacterium]|nr:hypothetical protein [Ignavibacteria bacterium]
MNISKLIPLYTCDDADIHEPLEIDYALLGYDKSTVHKHLTPPEYLEIESRLSNPEYYPQNETALPFEIGKRHRTKPQIIVTGHLGNRFYIRYFGDRVSILGSMQRLACSNNIELSCGKTQVELWRRFCLEYDIDPAGWIVSRIEFAFQAMIPFNMRDTQRVADSFKNKKFLPINAKTVDGPSHILAYDDEPTSILTIEHSVSNGMIRATRLVQRGQRECYQMMASICIVLKRHI